MVNKVSFFVDKPDSHLAFFFAQQNGESKLHLSNNCFRKSLTPPEYWKEKQTSEALDNDWPGKCSHHANSPMLYQYKSVGLKKRQFFSTYLKFILYGQR